MTPMAPASASLHVKIVIVGRIVKRLWSRTDVIAVVVIDDYVEVTSGHLTARM
jgi:hypothetical protein